MSDLIPWMIPWGGRVLAAVLAVLGFTLFLFAICRRHHVLPTCRRCGYLLFGLTELRCPECGWLPRTKSEVHRGKRRWRLAMVGLLIALAVPVYAAQRRIRQFGWEYYTWFGPVHWIDPYMTTTRLSIGGTSIEIEEDRCPWENRCRVIAHDASGGRILFPESGISDRFARYAIGSEENAVGRLTRDAEHVFVEDWSGGAHCCWTMHLLEVRDRKIREIAALETGNSQAAIKDIDHDGLGEVTLYDDAFAYWNTCFACSPFIKIIAHWDGQRFVLARDLMRNDIQNQEKLITADDLRDAWQKPETYGDNHVPVLVWKCLLENIAAGQAQQGFALMRQAWPAHQPDREKFEAEFITQFAFSKWVAQLAEFNGGELHDRVAAAKLASGAN